MNILLDFITVRITSGAGEYCRRIYFELIDRLNNAKNVKLFALYDSKKGIAYEDLDKEALSRKHGIVFVDCSKQKITDIVAKNNIDKFFIGCVQFVAEYKEIAELNCEVICVIHDARDEEFLVNHMYEYCQLENGSYEYKVRFSLDILNKLRYFRLTCHLLFWLYKLRHKDIYKHRLKLMQVIDDLLKNNSKAYLIAVSEYTKYSVLYNWNIAEKRVVVLNSPEKVINEDANIGDVKPDNEKLEELISMGKKYFIMVSSTGTHKNANKALAAFAKFTEYHKNIDLVLVGGSSCVKKGNVWYLPYLSDRDWRLAISHCYALVYPSLFEGFGYPPLEAMRYGKPVLSSNVTSMPEVLGNAPIYFSPIYNTDIFKAMMKLAESEEEWAKRSYLSLNQYRIAHERQECDLGKLLDLILKE